MHFRNIYTQTFSAHVLALFTLFTCRLFMLFRYPKELGSQADFMPTLIDLLGFRNNFTTMSNSLLDEQVKKRFAYFYGGTIIGLITDEGYVQYNFKSIVGASGTPEAQEKIKQELFAIDTAEAKLLEQNKWTK